MKDAGQLLRLSLPTSLFSSSSKSSDPGRKAQESTELVRLRIEQVGFAGKKTIWSSCLKDVSDANLVLTNDEQVLLKGGATKAQLENARKALDDLAGALKNQDPVGTLKLQTVAADRVYDLRAASLPKRTLPYSLPDDDSLAGLPLLKGRATVKMVIERKGGSRAGEFVLDDGSKSATLPLRMVVDGYRAPVTAGNFVDLISSKKYTNVPVESTDELFVVVEEPRVAGAPPPRSIPLELFYKNDKQPTYHYSSDDDNRATETFSDPFQAKGAIGMLHSPEDNDDADTKFFFLNWKQAFVAPGRNTLDGSSACFGYVLENQDALEQIKKGDVIREAVVTEGMENFVKGK